MADFADHNGLWRGSCLGAWSWTYVVRHQCVPSLRERVLHLAPRVILERRLLRPDVSAVTSDVSRVDGVRDVFRNADGAASRVDDPGALLHVSQRLLVDQAARSLVQGRIDCEHVKLTEELLEVLDATSADLLRGLGGKLGVVVIEELLAVERLEALQHAEADATGTERTNDLALEIVRGLGDSRNFPSAGDDLLVRRDKVADQDEDGHDDVLGDGDNVAGRGKQVRREGQVGRAKDP